MPVDLTNHIALVTGSAHRVGRAIALELARCGAHIMVHYHSADEGTVRDTVQAIKSLGVDAASVQANLAEASGVEEVFTAIREHFGALHILVNSASNFQKRRLLEVTLEDWNETLAINLTAPLLCTQAAATLMHENAPSGGAIVNICDRGVDRPWPDYAHHSVSKAALWSLTQVSAASLGPDIRVNAVIPGPVMKPAGRSLTDEQWQAFGEKTPLQRTGSPEDVARAVAYLAREDYITGTAIYVDGGAHLLS